MKNNKLVEVRLKQIYSIWLGSTLPYATMIFPNGFRFILGVIFYIILLGYLLNVKSFNYKSFTDKASTPEGSLIMISFHASFYFSALFITYSLLETLFGGI